MRRSLLVAIIFGLAIQTGQAQNRAPGPPWTCAVDAADDAGKLCIMAPDSGLKLYITDVVAQSTTATAGAFNLVASPKTASGAADCLAEGITLYPVGLGANGSRFEAAGNASAPTQARLRTPIVVPLGKHLCVVGDPTNTATVQLIGYLGG